MSQHAAIRRRREALIRRRVPRYAAKSTKDLRTGFAGKIAKTAAKK